MVHSFVSEGVLMEKNVVSGTVIILVYKNMLNL
jgi:hypothetical protein